MADIHKLIAAISPDVYCDPKVRDEVKKLARSSGFLKAAEEAKVLESSVLFKYDEAKEDALKKWGLQAPVEKHKLVYDSSTEGLEPIYFWILDFLDNLYRKIEKITDNFVSSPGSGHFSEMQTRAIQMQQEVSRTLGNVNTVIKSILNLIYDLKDFKLRLEPYDGYKNSKDSRERFSKLLSLKQIWLDNVDIRKGIGSINALASGQLDFVTLRDAFMAVDSLEKVDKLDLNDRVRRILKQRADEFFKWIDESEKSLRQRFEIEKNYLKSQVNMLKLYTKWVKPYLKATAKLQQKESTSAELVNIFSTTLMELTLLAQAEYNVEDDVDNGLLPEVFKKIKSRKYFVVLVVELKFRSIPQRVSQRGDWAFGGKTSIEFTSYALNKQEIETLNKEIEKDDLQESLKLIQGATDDSLAQIESEIEEFTGEKKKEEAKIKTSDDTNPFSALFSGLKSLFRLKDKKAEGDLLNEIKLDNEYEKIIRSQAVLKARENCFTVYDVYKKAHAMPSHDSYFEVI